MLSKTASDLMRSLYKTINSTNYVIYYWTDIQNMIDDENKDTYKDLFEEIRLNQCIILKYKDENQVCFAMTDKAKLLTQELDTMENRTKIKEAMIKTDEQGNSMVVLPTIKDKDIEQVEFNTKKSNKIKMFLYGFLGGIVGGLLASGIVYAIIEMLR